MKKKAAPPKPLNGISVIIHALDAEGKAIGRPECYVWRAEALAKLNHPTQIIGGVLGPAVAEALTRRPPPLLQIVGTLPAALEAN